MRTTTPVLVTGGRHYQDWERVWRVLDLVNPGRLIVGDAKGADKWAYAWAETRGVERMRYKADWDKHKRAAGPLRNQRMLDDGKPELVVAFPGGDGTADMMDRAERAGITVLRVSP